VGAHGLLRDLLCNYLGIIATTLRIFIFFNSGVLVLKETVSVRDYEIFALSFHPWTCLRYERREFFFFFGELLLSV
jgi:hypothetical protein